MKPGSSSLAPLHERCRSPVRRIRRQARTFIRLSNKQILHVNITLYSEVYNILYSEVYWSCGPRAAAGLPATGGASRVQTPHTEQIMCTLSLTRQDQAEAGPARCSSHTRPCSCPCPCPHPACDVLGTASPRLSRELSKAPCFESRLLQGCTRARIVSRSPSSVSNLAIVKRSSRLMACGSPARKGARSIQGSSPRRHHDSHRTQ